MRLYRQLTVMMYSARDVPRSSPCPDRILHDPMILCFPVPELRAGAGREQLDGVPYVESFRRYDVPVTACLWGGEYGL